MISVLVPRYGRHDEPGPKAGTAPECRLDGKLSAGRLPSRLLTNLGRQFAFAAKNSFHPEEERGSNIIWLHLPADIHRFDTEVESFG